MTNFPVIPTVPELQDLGIDVFDVIQYCKGLEVPYPMRPAKPTLPTNHSIEQVVEYSKKLEKYEISNAEYMEVRAKVNTHNRKVGHLVEEFIFEESRLNTIPVQYRSKVARYAYDQSHSSSYYEIYQTLCSLVNIFK